MKDLKGILLLGGAIGIGAVTAISAIGMTARYFLQRVKHWNKTAITAKYDSVRTEGPDHKLTFRYTLTNNTDRDYEIDDPSGLQFGSRLRDNDSFLFERKEPTTKLEFPIFVPEHSKVRLVIHTSFQYASADPRDASLDERYDWETKATQYVTKEMPNLGGFVILDPMSRYEIDFPSGWESRANDDLRISAAPTEAH